MAQLIVLRDDEVASLMDLDELATSLEDALRAISEERVSVPARTAARSAAGLLAAMPGYLEKSGLGAKLYSVYPDNPSLGMPSHQAVIVLFDESNGAPIGVLGATYITAIRTAMTAAVAARLLAQRTAEITVLGGGVQARSHLEAFSHLFPTAHIRLAARSSAVAAELASGWEQVEPFDSFVAAVKGADVVCCCTDSAEPILDDFWITDGCHVSSIGSGREVPSGTVERAEIYVESRKALLPPPAGTVELTGLPEDRVTEVGEVLSGRHPGRESPTAVTFFKSMGHAAEDLAAASLVMTRAEQRAIGTLVDL